MGCICSKAVVLPPASKFGTCALCVYVTLSGFICSWLLVLPFLFIQISAALLSMLSLPAAFFTVWLALHLAASYRKGMKVRFSKRSLGFR